MELPPNTLQVAWQMTPAGDEALHFPKDSWSVVRAIGDGQGAPSPQALITRLVTELIEVNAKANSTSPSRIRLEWITFGRSAATSPEATLVFHNQSLATIAALWKLPEDRLRDVLAGLILRSLDVARQPSGSA